MKRWNSFLRPLALHGLVAVLLVAPLVAGARGLVPCGGYGEEECGLKHIFIGINGIVQFLLMIGVFYGILMVSLAGFKLVMSQGNEGAVEEAKTRMTNVIIGFVIMLTAYLIVSTVLNVLTGKGFEFWKIS